MSKDYERHYKEFSLNISMVTRSWHHYLHLHNKATPKSKLLEVMNKAPRFWLDHRYNSVVLTIIYLGKIFDEDSRTYNIDKTLKSASENKQHFSKENLRKRKVQSAGEFQGLDDYIQNAVELDKDDFKTLKTEAKEARKIWQKMKPIRDKVFAHSEMMSDDQREQLLSAVKNSDFTKIVQRLLNISNALWEAEMNGRKPDFKTDHYKPIKWAQNDIRDLIKSLTDR